MFLLGGHGLMLGPQDIQLGVNESMKDTGKRICMYTVPCEYKWIMLYFAYDFLW